MINPVFIDHAYEIVRFLRFFKTHIKSFRKMRLGIIKHGGKNLEL